MKMRPRRITIMAATICSFGGLVLLEAWGVASPSQEGTVTSSASSPDTLCKKAGEYCVNRETSSGVCHVQEATERPQLGLNLKGPFNKRSDAVAQMCRLYEPASEDPGKCAGVAPQGICDKKLEEESWRQKVTAPDFMETMPAVP